MNHRLQILIPEALDFRLRQAAKRDCVSKGEWVRRAIQRSLQDDSLRRGHRNPLDRLAELDGPTGDIEVILRDIEAGRC